MNICKILVGLTSVKKNGDTFATVYFCDMFMSTIEVDEQFTSLASQQQYWTEFEKGLSFVRNRISDYVSNGYYYPWNGSNFHTIFWKRIFWYILNCTMKILTDYLQKRIISFSQMVISIDFPQRIIFFLRKSWPNLDGKNQSFCLHSIPDFHKSMLACPNKWH